MAIPPRGANHIRTLSTVRGSGPHSQARHVRQFQLAWLEFERCRRLRERAAAVARISELDARLAEIDKLMGQSRRALEESTGVEPEQETAERDRRKGGSFKRHVLRY